MPIRVHILSLLVLLASELAVPAAEFQFEKLDRTYSEFVDDLSPIQLGLLEIALSSPRHSLTLEHHRASLERGARCSQHRVSLEARFHGHGTLDAELRLGALRSRLEDELELPSQTLVVEATVVIEKSDEGHLLTLVEAPEEVEVRIESRVAGRLVPLCKQMALVLVHLDCLAMEQALSRVLVPFPEPGAIFLLPDSELTSTEKRAFAGYLRAANQACRD